MFGTRFGDSWVGSWELTNGVTHMVNLRYILGEWENVEVWYLKLGSMWNASRLQQKCILNGTGMHPECSRVISQDVHPEWIRGAS